MIVSDSTTLIILFDLQRLELLSNLFDRVIIPSGVHGEITAKKSIEIPSFMEVQRVKPTELLEILHNILDRGESEAIALALELDMPLIIDEKKGRKIALREGVQIIGLLGIVYLNIKKKFLSINEAKVFLNDAVSHGYRIAPHLIDEMFGSL